MLYHCLKGPVINYREARGLQNCTGRQVKFYPQREGKVSAMLKEREGGGIIEVVLICDT